MSRYQIHRARRPLAWARRPSLATRLLGDAPPSAAQDQDPPTLIANEHFDDEPPFDPPDDDDDIFLGGSGEDGEEEVAPVAAPEPVEAHEDADLVLLTPAPIEDAQGDLFSPPPERVDRLALEAAFAALQESRDLFVVAETESEAPPFDEPTDAFVTEEAEDLTLATPEEELTLIAAPEEDPPFDAPDESDDVFGRTFERVEAPEPVLALPAPTPAPPEPAPKPAPASGETIAPPIRIHASWDRPEIGALLANFAEDHRLARADIEIARGGIDAAVMRFMGQESPNLLIIDTTLRRTEMLACLDRLASAIEPDCKIIILGALNDITLLRELALRGVSEYIVPPLKPDDLARAVCRLYAQADQSRVIAVIGARGGVGASTIAQNLAWSIAERQDACAALIDLDMAFGAAAFSLGQPNAPSMAESLADTASIDDDTLARAATHYTKRLQILSAQVTLERAFELEPDAVEALVQHARRANPYVVLDLPHAWNAWVKRALAAADEIVLVAGPDLASLRNAKSMLDALNVLREGKSPTVVTLCGVGVPKRPEINAKDFANAVGVAPAASFEFDPLLYGQCETKSQMIGEIDPESKTAAALDALAAALTGRKPSAKKRAADPAILARNDAADFAKSPKRGVRDLNPAANDNVLVLTRETSVGALAASFSNEPESAYIAKARNAAQAELELHAQTPRKRFGWGRVGIAACAAGLALANAAFLRAEDVSRQALAPAPAAAVAAPPAAPAASTPASRYASALLLLGEGRADEAAPLLRTAAEAGFAPAQHRLAQAYERGEGLGADSTLARAWTERAAAHGNVRAMHDLGAYYAQGETAADASAAFRWFRQAAEFGVADSQYNLGIIYAEGRGVAADMGEAVFWFRVAAAQGDTEAGARADDIALRVAPLLADQAEARARAFAPQTPNPAANAPA